MGKAYDCLLFEQCVQVHVIVEVRFHTYKYALSYDKPYNLFIILHHTWRFERQLHNQFLNNYRQNKYINMIYALQDRIIL
jgi:hypothetical protein